MKQSENAKFFVLQLLNSAIPTPPPPISEIMITEILDDDMITETISDTMLTEG